MLPIGRSSADSAATDWSADDSKRRRRGQKSLFSARNVAMVGSLAALLVFVLWYRSVNATSQSDRVERAELESIRDSRFDAVIVPGGGLADGKPAPWVAARLDEAFKYDRRTGSYLVLSRGTTHKPPPLDASGFPIDESAASARYLVEKGVDPSRILLESWSLDTIGNAAFARLMHADLRGWRRILVVTSRLHMPRTKAIFEWVFALPAAASSHRKAAATPARSVRLEFAEVKDADALDARALESRRQKEQDSLRKLKEETMPEILDLARLHSFLFEQHAAYRAMSPEDDARRQEERAKDGLARSY